MSENVSNPIGQKSFTNYRALVLSYELREAMLGILNPGVYSGFDTLHVYPDRLGITHEKSGITKTVYLTSEQGGGVGKSQPTGVFVTKFGTIVHDDTEVFFPKPADDGLYMVYAKYLRPTAGDEYTVMVPVTYLTMMMTDQKGETDIKRLSETDTPITMFRKAGDTFTLLSHDEVVMSTPNPMDMGNMTQLDLLTSMGTLGLGRFKYLGRTLQSISQFMSDQIDWNHWQEAWDATLLRRVGWPSYPDGSAKDDTDFGVKFISSIWTIWNDLVALDHECQNLWAKLGYPDAQPENEKVLLIANTVWQNMTALREYSDKLSDDIWARLGLIKGEPSEVHSILDKADTVWNNILKLLDKLDKLDNHVRTDSFESGGIRANLDHIWATLGYDNQVDIETYKTILKSNSVWDNFKAIFNYIESDVEKNNDFVITQLVANGKENTPIVKLGTSSHNKKTFLWEVSENTAQSGGSDPIKDYRLELDRPWADDKFDQRVALLVWRPSKSGLRLYITGGITQAKFNEKNELYMNNGGMALLYKLTKTQTKWYIQILNPGSGGGGGGGDVTYESQGLMPGYERIEEWSDWTGPTNYIISLNPCVRVSSEVGVSEIIYDSFVVKTRDNTGYQQWGARSTVYLALARPTEAQLGCEKIIRLGGHFWNVFPDEGRGRAVDNPGRWQENHKEYDYTVKAGVCLNFSLPAQTIKVPFYYREANWQGWKGLITHKETGSFLKWPGDWVKLRAEQDIDGSLIWRLIEHGDSGHNSLLLWQFRQGEDYTNENQGGNNHCDLAHPQSYWLRGGFFDSPDGGTDNYWIRINYINGGEHPHNSFARIIGRNYLSMRIPIDIAKGNDRRLRFSEGLPFPDPDEVGEMRMANTKNHPGGIYFWWGVDPTQDWYGKIGISNWDYNEVHSDDWGWYFPLGGPYKAMANFVLHNVNFEES